MTKTYLPIIQRWKHYHEPSILSFVAGWVDAVGFIALFGIYTNHITGNIITAGAEAALGGVGVWALLLATFIVVVGIVAWCEQRWHERFPNILIAFLIAETLLLFCFMSAGLLLQPTQGISDLSTIITGILGVSAMAVRNAIIRTILSSTATSTLMTGNIAQLTTDLVTVYISSHTCSDKKSSARKNIKKLLPSILSFSSGAVIGAIGYIFVSFACIIFPILLMVYICYREWRFAFSPPPA